MGSEVADQSRTDRLGSGHRGDPGLEVGDASPGRGRSRPNRSRRCGGNRRGRRPTPGMSAGDPPGARRFISGEVNVQQEDITVARAERPSALHLVEPASRRLDGPPGDGQVQALPGGRRVADLDWGQRSRVGKGRIRCRRRRPARPKHFRERRSERVADPPQVGLGRRPPASPPSRRIVSWSGWPRSARRRAIGSSLEAGGVDRGLSDGRFLGDSIPPPDRCLGRPASRSGRRPRRRARRADRIRSCQPEEDQTHWALTKGTQGGDIALGWPASAMARRRTAGRMSSSRAASDSIETSDQSRASPRGVFDLGRRPYAGDSGGEIPPSTSGLTSCEVGQQILYQPPVSITRSDAVGVFEDVGRVEVVEVVVEARKSSVVGREGCLLAGISLCRVDLAEVEAGRRTGWSRHAKARPTPLRIRPEARSGAEVDQGRRGLRGLRCGGGRR